MKKEICKDCDYYFPDEINTCKNPWVDHPLGDICANGSAKSTELRDKYQEGYNQALKDINEKIKNRIEAIEASEGCLIDWFKKIIKRHRETK